MYHMSCVTYLVSGVMCPCFFVLFVSGKVVQLVGECFVINRPTPSSFERSDSTLGLGPSKLCDIINQLVLRLRLTRRVK